MRNRDDAAAKAGKLVAQMTIEERASQLRYDAPAIPRLGIPAYNWWNEVLHGVARAGTATVFPQAIGLAAMFDEDAQEEVAAVIAREARAKYNGQSRHNDRDIYKGLTVWSPNINTLRSPPAANILRYTPDRKLFVMSSTLLPVRRTWLKRILQPLKRLSGRRKSNQSWAHTTG